MPRRTFFRSHSTPRVAQIDKDSYGTSQKKLSGTLGSNFVVQTVKSTAKAGNQTPGKVSCNPVELNRRPSAETVFLAQCIPRQGLSKEKKNVNMYKATRTIQSPPDRNWRGLRWWRCLASAASCAVKSAAAAGLSSDSRIASGEVLVALALGLVRWLALSLRLALL